MAETVTVTRPGPPTGGMDAYRRPIPGAPVEHTERGAMFAPAGSVERYAAGRHTVIDRDTLYFFRAGVDIAAADQVHVRGAARDVDGDPERWVDPFTSREVGLVVRLKHVTEG